MTLHVADVRANLNENIHHAVKTIGRSADRLKVFQSIYRGSAQVKTVSEIARATQLDRMRVLQEAGKLSGNGIVEKLKHNGETAYRKDATFVHHKNKILELVKHPKKLSKYPTKQMPRVTSGSTYRVTIKSSAPKPKQITVDDVLSFRLVRKTASGDSAFLRTIAEERIKHGLKGIVGEKNDFKDWGGERNDFHTTKFRVGPNRCSAAFALKGKATQGALTPKKMGKNGDQIARLFSSPAEAVFVVYHSKIDQSILEQMRAYAVARCLGGQKTLYGVIDGDDLARLYRAYKRYF